MELISIEMLASIFSHSNPWAFAEKFVLFLSAWTIIRKSVNTQFKELKDSVKGMTVAIEKMGTTIEDTVTYFKERMESAESRIKNLETKHEFLLNEFKELKKGVIK